MKRILWTSLEMANLNYSFHLINVDAYLTCAGYCEDVMLGVTRGLCSQKLTF